MLEKQQAVICKNIRNSILNSVISLSCIMDENNYYRLRTKVFGFVFQLTASASFFQFFRYNSIQLKH